MTTDPNDQSNKAIWDIESTHPELMAPLRTALGEVIDPELGLNVVELGLVRNVRILEHQAEINMILTTPFCPYGPAMLESVRKMAEEALKRPVSIEVGLDMWDPSMMEDGAGSDWAMYLR
jgi:metal-sulfur cluster biosynthetic enzyme